MLHDPVENEGMTLPALLCFYDFKLTTKLH